MAYSDVAVHDLAISSKQWDLAVTFADMAYSNVAVHNLAISNKQWDLAVTFAGNGSINRIHG